MHIHGGHLNPNSSLAGTHAASSALAARRAEETRKKLFAASSELDATSSTEGAWMVTAWAGGNGASTPDRSSQGGADSPNSDSSKSERELEELPRTAAAGPVSYWA
jgi:hypothetical protein